MMHWNIIIVLSVEVTTGVILMSDEIMLVFGEDGVAREYDDTWDITIHCESKEEQDMAWKKLKGMEWISCSERLPNYIVPVLTWDGSAYCVEKRIPCIRDDDGEPIEGDWWVSDDYDEYESEFYPNLRDGAAIAWMPLPEPYRKESE